MRFKEYINEARVLAIDGATKRKINKDIHNIVKKTYFKKIPLQDLINVLDKYGIVLLQEDQTEWSGFLLGGVNRTEQVYFDLGWKASEENKRYQVIPNATLALSYYVMPKSGNYEIISYVT